jgi:hypothetical protein
MKARFFDAELLAGGAAPPGGWRPDPRFWGGSTWRGELSWATAHGPAECLWSLGKPSRAANVLLPDGGRIAFAEATMDSFLERAQGGPGEWRWLDAAAGRWRRCKIAFGADDAVAEPLPDARPAMGATVPGDLESALRSSAAAAAFCADDGRAQKLYAAMCNVVWRNADGEDWSCSWRYAGGVVAEVCGLGEEYVDWYCSGGEGDVAPEAAELLSGLGWRPKTEEEAAADRAAARAEIAAWAGRPAGPRPGWFAPRPGEEFGAEVPENAWDAARWLAGTGRVEREEFDSVCARLVG